jgi:hypothetical protein
VPFLFSRLGPARACLFFALLFALLFERSARNPTGFQSLEEWCAKNRQGDNFPQNGPRQYPQVVEYTTRRPWFLKSAQAEASPLCAIPQK